MTGKNTLITGGTGALGKIVAKKFLQEGFKVASSFLSVAEAAPSQSETFMVRADVSKEEDVVLIFDKVIANFGSVDILINLVGGFIPGSNIRDVSSKDWDFMMNLNLKTAFLCSREFLRRHANSNYGRIINIAAMPALKPTAGRGPYAVSKAGVVTLTAILGDELKGTGVTVNAVAPSIIRTEANMLSMPAEDKSKWVTPEHIADLMLFLCSSSGESINGVCIPVFAGV